jgi:stalled ribosome rescue protein Dom34
MITKKNIGIWMDHSNARLIEFTNFSVSTRNIMSKFTTDEKTKSLAKSENLMHNKEQHQQTEYYNRIAETIQNFDDVLLFGPTDAKTELFNLLKKEHRYSKINVEVKDTDNMTDNQQHAFVRAHFAKS